MTRTGKQKEYERRNEKHCDLSSPGLFEFYELYRRFLPLFRTHREYFYDWCEIGSIYGAPENCLWGGDAFPAGSVIPRR